ncbi:type II secretion system protein [Candidatus Saccharibacteria bacterium]|nr:type II secretion system protein [Candidatus Saccharibacteria bacterium]
MKNARGFTIVELLIVIVVIGILAVIAISTFGSAQVRAENTKTAEAVKSYIKAIQAYKADNGTYPIAFNTWPCIGANAINDCARISGATTCFGAGGTGVNAAFDALVQPYLGSTKPEISNQQMNCGGSMFAAGYYESTATGTSGQITFYQKTNVPCSKLGGVSDTGRAQSDDTTVCYLYFN